MKKRYLSLFTLSVLFLVPVGKTWAACPTPTPNTASQISLYSQFDITGQNLGTSEEDTVVKVYDAYENQEIALYFEHHFGTTIDDVHLNIPTWWVGKTVELIVEVDCPDGSGKFSGSTSITIAEPAQPQPNVTIDFDESHWVSWLEPIPDNLYGGLGVVLSTEGRYPNCEYPNGDPIPGCTVDYRAFSHEEVDYASSGERVLGGRFINTVTDGALQMATNHAVVEFTHPVDYVSIFGQSDSSSGTGMSYEMQLYDWDGEFLGRLVGYNCEQGCTKEIAFQPDAVSLHKYIKTIKFGGIMDTTGAYFDDLTFNALPAGVDYVWGEIIKAFDETGQASDDFSLGTQVTVKVKVTVRESRGKLYKVKFNKAKIILKHYPVGDPRRVITLTNPNTGNKFHAIKNIANGENALLRLAGTLPDDPELIGTEFKIKGKIRLYDMANLDEQILVHSIQQDYFGIVQ